MLALVNKGINNESIFHDEEVKPVPISELDVIFHEVLEELSNSKNKLI